MSYCQHCGAELHDGAQFCEKCGTARGATAPPSSGHGFDANDAMAIGGFGASLMGRGGGGDVASYLMSKSALENLESSGQANSPMADLARAGLQITKIKIIVGCTVFVIAIIAMIIFISYAQHQQQQFQHNFNNPTGPTGFPQPPTLPNALAPLAQGLRLALTRS